MVDKLAEATIPYGKVWYGMHNGPFYIELAPYGFFLAGSEHANCLHRTMHISYFKLCHLQARTLKDAGGPQSTGTIPQTSREILSTFGRRSSSETDKGRTVFTVVRSLR